MVLDTRGVCVSFIWRMSDAEAEAVPVQDRLTTENELRILADAEVHARLMAFRKLRNPFSRHQLKTAICAHGMRGDMADRLIKKAASAVTRRG